nr:hypothetical protein [Tanacetum cinerariifolium]
TMADVNVNALVDQAPTMAPTHTNDQIMPHIRWDIGGPSITPLLLPEDFSVLPKTYSSYQDAGVEIQTALLGVSAMAVSFGYQRPQLMVILAPFTEMMKFLRDMQLQCLDVDLEIVMSKMTMKYLEKEKPVFQHDEVPSIHQTLVEVKSPDLYLWAVDLVPSVEETKPFETDESMATPPPPPAYLTTSRMYVRTQTPISFLSEAEVARLLALPTPPSSLLTSLSSPLPQIPSPPKRLLFTASTLRFEVGESSAAARQSGSIMDRRVVNLWVSYQEDLCKRESEEFYAWHQDAQDDHAAVIAEIQVFIRERLAYKRERESGEVCQAVVRSKAHNRALEARITTIETQLYRIEWQRQDAVDHATRAIMRIQELEAGARVDTLEETGSSS